MAVLKEAAISCSACSALVAKLAKCSAASRNHAPSGNPWTVFDTPTLVLSQVTVGPHLLALVCVRGGRLFPILHDARGGEVGLLQAAQHASPLNVFRFAQFQWSYLGHLGLRLGLTLVSRLLGKAGSVALGHLRLPEERLVRTKCPELHELGQAQALGVPCCDLLRMGCFGLVATLAFGYVKELLHASNPRCCPSLSTW